MKLSNSTEDHGSKKRQVSTNPLAKKHLKKTIEKTFDRKKCQNRKFCPKIKKNPENFRVQKKSVQKIFRGPKKLALRTLNQDISGLKRNRENFRDTYDLANFMFFRVSNFLEGIEQAFYA